MLQAAARRFRHWFQRSQQASPACADEDEGLPRPALSPAPQPVGLEDTEPVNIEDVLRPPPPPSPRDPVIQGDGAVASPVKAVSDWSAVIAAAKRRCESGRA